MLHLAKILSVEIQPLKIVFLLFFPLPCNNCVLSFPVDRVAVIWFQGGDGLFNEILNGLLSSRHKAPYPPAPIEFGYTGSLDQDQQHRINSFNDRASNENDAHEPLISTSESNGGGISNISMSQKISCCLNLSLGSSLYMHDCKALTHFNFYLHFMTEHQLEQCNAGQFIQCLLKSNITYDWLLPAQLQFFSGSCSFLPAYHNFLIHNIIALANADQDPVLSFPNDWFRLGLIPSGSTDAIVIRWTLALFRLILTTIWAG